MQENKYQVIMELREDLTDAQLDYIKNYIANWQEAYSIINIKDNIFCLNGSNHDKSHQFGSMSFFYATMLEKKEYMQKLEYYDFVDEEFDYAV